MTNWNTKANIDKHGSMKCLNNQSRQLLGVRDELNSVKAENERLKEKLNAFEKLIKQKQLT